MTKAYIFFSVHEELFHKMAEGLLDRGVESFSGFVWGRQQARALSNRGITYDPLLIFSRHILPLCNDKTPADLGWLARREQELGVSIQRMLASERHLLANRNFDQIMRMAEVALREIAAAYDRARPDFVFSEDISCFHSYAHFVLARERGIPFWCIGSARLPNRVAVYSAGLQRWERVDTRYHDIRKRGLAPDERLKAEEYIATFRHRPQRPTGMDSRAVLPSIGRADFGVLRHALARYWGDPKDPTVAPPLRVLHQRIRRIARVRVTKALGVFDVPVDGERYVLYPIHFQPEASTLVQAPLYLDQLALLEDIARSLPIGYRLYVKEHVSNRGRRPLKFYNAIRKIPAARLLGPDTDTWSLIRNASAIAVITGTMGWEGLLFDKPVVSFGDVFYNRVPHVYQASLVPKDGWYELLRKALTKHQPDHEALLAYVAAMQQTSHPGFIGNPSSFPTALSEANVALLLDALASEAGLPGSYDGRVATSQG